MLGLIPNPWLILAIVVALGGAYVKGRWDGTESAEGKAAIAVAKAQQDADRLANELIIAQAANLAANERTVTVYRDKVNNAPVTTTCGPAVHDALRGLHQLHSRKPNAP